MAAIPVTNPRLPFMGLIPGGLIHGRMIRINGAMLPNADRFSINLQTGPSIDADSEPLDDDVCMHLDVRASENAIIRNHFGQEGWGYEERSDSPIFPGSNFEILILAQQDCFKIAVNGNHFCEFQHRLPLALVRFIYLCRDANIFSVTLEGDTANNAQGNPSAPPYMGNPNPAGGYGYNPNSASLSYGPPQGGQFPQY